MTRLKNLQKCMIKCPKCGKRKMPNSRCSCGYDDIYHDPFPENPIIR